jgi:hypothetical protein
MQLPEMLSRCRLCEQSGIWIPPTSLFGGQYSKLYTRLSNALFLEGMEEEGTVSRAVMYQYGGCPLRLRYSGEEISKRDRGYQIVLSTLPLSYGITISS